MKPGLLAAALVLLGWGPPGPPGEPWREVRHAGRSRYQVVEGAGGGTLRVRSHDQNSALLRAAEIDPTRMTLRWRWRVLRHPEGADPEIRARDDRAAGVLVIVRRSMLPWRNRALMYQWSPARPMGEWSRSPYSREVRTLVLRSAPADSTWREEERDLGHDLATAFGEAPARIQAIGVICDTDNTGAEAEAEFGPLEIAERGESR